MRGEATEVWLIAWGDDSWRLLHRFRLTGAGHLQEQIDQALTTIAVIT